MLACMQARYMALDFRADPWAEMEHLASQGVDGFFTDCPSTAAAWRSARLAAAAAAAVAAAEGQAEPSSVSQTPGPVPRQGSGGSMTVLWSIFILSIMCTVAGAGLVGWGCGQQQAARQGYRHLQQRYEMGAASAGVLEQSVRPKRPSLLGWLRGLAGAGSKQQQEQPRTQQLAERDEQGAGQPRHMVLQPVPSDAVSLLRVSSP